MKPAAKPLLSIAADMNVAPNAIMMVGDSLHDVDCAKAAGATAVGVLTGVAGKGILVGSADWVIGSVVEIDAAFLQHLNMRADFLNSKTFEMLTKSGMFEKH